MPVFSHLHCHTQFSLLDGAARITSMMKKAQADGMPGVVHREASVSTVAVEPPVSHRCTMAM